jgi:hypothetical protein
MSRGRAIGSQSSLRMQASKPPLAYPNRRSLPSELFEMYPIYRPLQSVLRVIFRLAKRPVRSLWRSAPPTLVHLDETQLVAHLDGELSDEARKQVTDHLQSCWSCRSRFRQLCATVRAYVATREDQLPDPSSESTQRVDQLRQRLVQNEKGTPPA